MRGEATCAVTVPVPPHVVYGFWADVASYPRWHQYLERVDVFDDRNSRWFLHLPGGHQAVLTTEVTMAEPRSAWAWNSTGQGLASFTKVRMQSLEDGRTRIEVRRFHGASKENRSLLEAWVPDRRAQLRVDLQRFVAYMRTQVMRPTSGAFDVRIRRPSGTSA